MKIGNVEVTVKEKDDSQEYKEKDIKEMMREEYEDKLVFFVPNACGGETMVTIKISPMVYIISDEPLVSSAGDEFIGIPLYNE